MSDTWDIRNTDTSLRDGSHHKRHQFTKDEVHAIVAALDTAGVPVIEVTHGDGLGGSSFNYGFSKTPEQELIKLAAETAEDARIAFLMLPGAPRKTSRKRRATAGRSAVSPPIAPRPTSPPSTSAWPAERYERPRVTTAVPGGQAQAHRRPGGPADRDRFGDQARAGRRQDSHTVSPANEIFRRTRTCVCSRNDADAPRSDVRHRLARLAIGLEAEVPT